MYRWDIISTACESFCSITLGSSFETLFSELCYKLICCIGAIMFVIWGILIAILYGSILFVSLIINLSFCTKCIILVFLALCLINPFVDLCIWFTIRVSYIGYLFFCIPVLLFSKRKKGCCISDKYSYYWSKSKYPFFNQLSTCFHKLYHLKELGVDCDTINILVNILVFLCVCIRFIYLDFNPHILSANSNPNPMGLSSILNPASTSPGGQLQLLLGEQVVIIISSLV